MRIGHCKSEDDINSLLSLITDIATKTNDPDTVLISAGLLAMRSELAVHVMKENEILVPAAIFAEELVQSHHYGRRGRPVH